MNKLIFVVIAFFIGLIFGSFYNVVGLRALTGEKLSYPASHCVKCGYSLKPKDLVPVFSWLSLKGRCRSCGDKISPIYPLGELFNGISFAAMTYLFLTNLDTESYIINLILFSLFTMTIASDLKAMIVPDRFFIIGTILILGIRIINNSNPLSYLLQGLAISGGLLLIALITSYRITDEDEIEEVVKEIQEENLERLSRGKKPIKYDRNKLRGYKMGGADFKIYLPIGIAIGFIPAVESLILASISLLITTFLINVFSKNKKISTTTAIPFFPFIGIGVLLSFFIPVSNITMWFV